jgi:hypothetical protein
MPGRPFENGKSRNPGGRPKVLAELRDLAHSHAPEAPEAIAELARLARKARSETARIAAIRELLERVR